MRQRLWQQTNRIVSYDNRRHTEKWQRKAIGANADLPTESHSGDK